MRSQIPHPDIRSPNLRRFAGGVALAAVAGLLMGAALKPELDLDPIEGPQQLIAGGGPRVYVQTADAGVAAYHGALPAYVVGTDHLPKPEPAMLAYDDRAEPAEADDANHHASDVMAYEAPALQVARWRPDQPSAPHYPSQQGGAWHESDLPPAPDGPESDSGRHSESDHAPL